MEIRAVRPRRDGGYPHQRRPGRRLNPYTGLEFKAVAILACDEEVLPLRARIVAAADEVELDEAYATERHLYYVACTRARDRLLVTSWRRNTASWRGHAE
ncbi:3'-5' exonuclease [Methylobacterium sp. P31]